MSTLSLNKLVPKLIRFYYWIDSPLVRWVLRRVVSYRVRTILLNRFLHENLEDMPRSASTAPNTSERPLSNDEPRRAALYTSPFEEDENVRIMDYHSEAPLDLERAPYWGNGPKLHSRTLVPLPKCIVELRDAEIEGDCLGAFVGKRFVSMLASSAAPHCFATYQKHEIISWGRVHSFKLKRKPVTLDVELGVYFASNNCYGDNYFHALTDLVPSLITILQHLSVEERRIAAVLMPTSIPASVRSIVDAIVASCGVACLDFGNGTLIRARRLLMSPYRSQMNDIAALDRLALFHVNPSDVLSARDTISKVHPIGEMGTEIATPLIYATRAGLISSGKRHILNCAEIIALVEKTGGKVLYPEQLTIEEQISESRHADLIVFDAGAAVANLLFCRPGTCALVLTHRYARPNLFMSLAQALGIRLGFVYGEVTEVSGMNAAHLDAHIHLDSVERAIRYFMGPEGSRAPDGWH